MKGKAILAAALVIAFSLGLYLAVLGILPALYGAAVGRIAQSTDGLIVSPPILFPPPTVETTAPPVESTTPGEDGIEPLVYYMAFPEAPWDIRTTDTDDKRATAVSALALEERLQHDYRETIEADGEPDHKCRNVHYVITPPAEFGMDPYEVCLEGFLITADGVARKIPDFDVAIYETAHRERYIKIPYERENVSLDPAIASLTETYFRYRDDRPDDMMSVACLGSPEGVMHYWSKQETDYQSLSEEQFMALLTDSVELMTFDILHMPEIHVQVSGANVSATISAPANYLLPQYGGTVYGDALRQLLAYRLLLVSHSDAYWWGSGQANLFYLTDLSEDSDMDAIRQWLTTGDTAAMTHDTVAFEVTETGVLRHTFHHTNCEYIVEVVFQTNITLPSSLTGGLS